MRPRDLFHCDTMLIWHINPVYTLIPVYHYLTEARYRGAKLVLISPDVSPSHTHADLHVPVSWGADPALALAMCQVIVEEGLVDADFVRDPDRPVAAGARRHRPVPAGRRHRGRRSRRPVLPPRSGPVVSCRPTGATCSATTPRHSWRQRRGHAASTAPPSRCSPLFVRLGEHLRQYTPEKTQETTGVHPDTVRKVARMAASGRTLVAIGGSASKTTTPTCSSAPRTSCSRLRATGVARAPAPTGGT